MTHFHRRLRASPPANTGTVPPDVGPASKSVTRSSGTPLWDSNCKGYSSGRALGRWACAAGTGNALTSDRAAIPCCSQSESAQLNCRAHSDEYCKWQRQRQGGTETTIIIISIRPAISFPVSVFNPIQSLTWSPATVHRTISAVGCCRWSRCRHCFPCHRRPR